MDFNLSDLFTILFVLFVCCYFKRYWVNDLENYHRRWRQHRAITVDTVGIVDTVDTVETVDTVDTVDTGDTIDTIEHY